ncbi:MAG: hypothetical protein ACFCU5_09360 [Pleurocapsa sp.]
MLRALVTKNKVSIREKNHFIASIFSCLFFVGIIFNLSSHSSVAQIRNKSITIDDRLISHPLDIEGISGGTLTAIEITNTEHTATGYCNGFVSRQPSHILKLNSFFNFLKLEVQSSADTTILIKGPGGVWCNDDSDDVNPTIEGEWQPGIYQVWIGSYRANSNNNYRIRITATNNP